MIKAVILDFDDTLCLTEAATFHLENEVLRRMGRDPMTREIHKTTWGMTLHEAIQLRSPGIDVDAFWSIMPQVHQEFVADGKVDTVLDSNITTLDRLVASGKQLYIVTSRTETEMMHIMEPEHHLASRIAHFYHKGNTIYTKPDPRVFEAF